MYVSTSIPWAFLIAQLVKICLQYRRLRSNSWVKKDNDEQPICKCKGIQITLPLKQPCEALAANEGMGQG